MDRAAEPTDDAPSIHALFRRHFDDVYRMVAHLLGPGAGQADVEDVTQQVFMAAHRALPRYRGEGRPTTWLYGIATRVVLNNLRSWRRRRRLVAALESALEGDVAVAACPERDLAARQELNRVWRCLMRVGPKKRVVYVLHVVEGRSGEEIAELLEIPVATVWTRLHHARRELNAALDRDERRNA